MNKKNHLGPLSSKSLKPNPIELNTSDSFQDNEEKDKLFVNNKLISSLQQSLRHLMQCLMNSSIENELINQVLLRRHRDKIIDKSEIKIECDKEEFSSLLYFKMQGQLKHFPSSIADKLLSTLNTRYNSMLQQHKINILKFYQFTRNLIYSQIDQILNLHKAIPVENGERVTAMARLLEINRQMKEVYSCLDVGDHWLLGELGVQGVQGVQEEMAAGLWRRNEKILRDIVEFSTKMRKNLTKQKYQTTKCIDEPKAKSIPQFKIRKSYSLERGRQSTQKAQLKPLKRALNPGRLYFKSTSNSLSNTTPISTKQKARLKL